MADLPLSILGTHASNYPIFVHILQNIACIKFLVPLKVV